QRRWRIHRRGQEVRPLGQSRRRGRGSRGDRAGDDHARPGRPRRGARRCARALLSVRPQYRAERTMFGKLNHLAITSDHYTLLGMFYRAVFGLKSSGDTVREIGAISVGDAYLGMTLIPRRGGRKAGLDHFGIEVEDLDKVRRKVAQKYPDIEIVKRPGNRPFASYSAHDPAGNYFDLSQPGHENRAEVYAKGEWKQETTSFRVARARGGARRQFLRGRVRARSPQRSDRRR